VKLNLRIVLCSRDGRARTTALVGVYWAGVARMNEESSVEDEGARCGTQHEWRGWTSRFGRGKVSGAARESGRRFGQAGQSLFCLAGKGFEGVEGGRRSGDR
jgi:hypothetical protein